MQISKSVRVSRSGELHSMNVKRKGLATASKFLARSSRSGAKHPASIRVYPTVVVTEGGREEHLTFRAVCGPIGFPIRHPFAGVYVEVLPTFGAQRVATAVPRRAFVHPLIPFMHTSSCLSFREVK